MANVSLNLEENLINRIDDIRQQMGLNRTQVIQQAVTLWLEQQDGALPDVVDFPLFSFLEQLPQDPSPRLIRVMSTYTSLFNIKTKRWKAALQNGTRLQVLLLDPDSNYARARAQDLLPNKSDWSDETIAAHVPRRIKDSIEDIATLAEEAGATTGQVEVRTHNRMPYFPFYSIDNNIFIGYYIRDTEALYTKYLHFKSLEHDYARHAILEFKKLWDEGQVRFASVKNQEVST